MKKLIENVVILVSVFVELFMLRITFVKQIPISDVRYLDEPLKYAFELNAKMHLKYVIDIK